MNEEPVVRIVTGCGIGMRLEQASDGGWREVWYEKHVKGCKHETDVQPAAARGEGK